MGRKPSGKIPFQPLKNITERHHEIMRRLIAGETQHKIAAELGMTECRLSIICNSPLFQEALACKRGKVEERFVETTGNIKDRIDKLQNKAVDILEKIVSDPTDELQNAIPLRLKKETALNILEIAGNGKKNGERENNIGDVINLIKEGYKLAKMQQLEESGNSSTKPPPEPVNITPSYTDISPEPFSIAIAVATPYYEDAPSKFAPVIDEKEFESVSLSL